MKKLHLLTLALAGVLSAACLQAQTGIGENHADATFAVETIDFGYDGDRTGWGAAGKVNFAVAKNWDLAISGGVVTFDFYDADVYYDSLRGGVTWHNALGSGQVFVTGEIGVDWVVVDDDYYDETEDATVYCGKAGYMFQFGEKVQLGLYGGYRHYDSDFGTDNLAIFGGQLAVRLGRIVSLVGGIEVDDDSDMVGTAGVRFHF